MKRALDILIALVALVVSAPFVLAGAIAVRLSSPGPVLYRARRAGRDGAVFEMLKLRTMHDAASGAAITAGNDPRVFPAGSVLRRLKIDELPQFVNVLRGDMAIVGPRPEDPRIVDRHYTSWMHETLAVRPGITSPGALFYYAQGEALIDPADPEGSYATRLLAPKLAIERAYLDRATPLSDIAVMIRTVFAVLGHIAGRGIGAPARDRRAAERWCPAASFPETPA